jgi:tetratricopeptide (TPR) repeat protein
MKRISLAFISLVFAIVPPTVAQNKSDNSKIDMMLIRGDFKRVVDTCNQILTTDTINAEVYYKLGLAYQNLLFDDKSFDCFLKAAAIAPDDNNYKFTVAKSYYIKGKSNKAKPLLLELCAADSMNWAYAYYLTCIFMQEKKYDESIKVYNRFHKQDSVNYVFMDKIGFANLRKGDFDIAIEWFNSSLALNPDNINSIKNLAYLYSVTADVDTALQLLTKGIQIDSTDIDLYERRAAINFTIFNYKKALDDYLKILSSGDSSVLYLKRAGIGYANSLQPQKAIEYLLKAYDKDTSDYLVLSYLAQNYMQLFDMKNCVYYYRCLIKMATPAVTQLGLNYLLLAEVLKADNQYLEAISAYIKSQEYRSDNNVYMSIANIYDEKLKDTPKAIRYYELYLNKIKNSKNEYDTDYSESIKNRVQSLKKQKKGTTQP